MIHIEIITMILYLLAGIFSYQYLRFEQNCFKFFLNFILFGIGLSLFILGKDSITLYAGVEFLGISSLFLISYYSYRSAPVKNSLYVLYFYKFADFILLISLLFDYPHNQNYVLIGIITVAFIKSGAFPFSTWPSRAMEGPTGSSAIFYASLALNIGPILVLKYLDKILSHPIALYYLISIGFITFIYAAIQSRIQTDSKNAICYSSLGQIGLVFVELGFNFPTLGVIHLFANSYLKCYQLLRTPSLIHEYHFFPYEEGVIFGKNGFHIENILPKKLRKTIYHLALHHFYLDRLYVYIGEIISFLFENKIIMGICGIFCIYYQNFSFMLLLMSIPLLKETKLNKFILYFVLYKILETSLDYFNHMSVSLMSSNVIFALLFIILLVRFPNYKILILLFMLQFADFPYLFEGRLNEELLEYLIHHHNIHEMLMYGLANTFFNIGIFHFVFHHIYLKKVVTDDYEIQI